MVAGGIEVIKVTQEQGHHFNKFESNTKFYKPATNKIDSNLSRMRWPSG